MSDDDLRSATRVIAPGAHEHEPYVRNWFPAWRERFEYWHVADLDRMAAEETLSLIGFDVHALLRDLAVA